MKPEYPVIFNSHIFQPMHRYNTIEEKYNSMKSAWPDKNIRDKYCNICLKLEFMAETLQTFHKSLWQDALIDDRNLRLVHEQLESTIKQYQELLDLLEKSEKCQIVRT